MSIERWPFGTVLYHGRRSQLIAMVVCDRGSEIDMISLSGEHTDPDYVRGFYRLGVVWKWQYSRERWLPIDGP